MTKTALFGLLTLLFVTVAAAQEDDFEFLPVDNGDWVRVADDLVSVAYPPGWAVTGDLSDELVLTIDGAIMAQMRYYVIGLDAPQNVETFATEARAALRDNDSVTVAEVVGLPTGQAFLIEQAITLFDGTTLYNLQYTWPIGSRAVVLEGVIEAPNRADEADDEADAVANIIETMHAAARTFRINSAMLEAWRTVVSVDGTFSVRAPQGWELVGGDGPGMMTLRNAASFALITIAITDLGDPIPLEFLEGGFTDVLESRDAEDIEARSANRPFGDVLEATANIPMQLDDETTVYRRELRYNAMRGSRFIIMSASAALEIWPDEAQTMRDILDTFEFTSGDAA